MIDMKFASRGGKTPALRTRAVTAIMIASVLLAACAGSKSSTPVVAQGSADTTVVKPSDAHSAVLADLHGTVEVKTGDGPWTMAQAGQALIAQQHVRTGALSNVTLAYYDGSRTNLGAEAEITVDALDAANSGPRVVQLSQVSGESQHSVAQSDDTGSRYDVNTPAGSGSATNADFTVVVRPGQLSQFWVETGAVSVVNENATVVVLAGQSTVVLVGQPPIEPAFRITGAGQVTQIGAVGSETVTPPAAAPSTATNQNDKIALCHATGSATNPYVEITVSEEGATHGHAKHSGDIIPAPAEGCPMATPSTEATTATWTIAGQPFLTGASTVIFGNPQPGDWVSFEGHLQADGARVADRIMVISHSPNDQFAFSGKVESISDTVWTVSGRAVQVDEQTAIGVGLEVGDDVQVAGGVTAEGVFWAARISPLEAANPNFRFAGIVGSMDQGIWFISGIAVTVDETTLLNSDFVVGNPVMVEGVIQADGTWRATSIELVTPEGYRFEFGGAVQAINPWVVAGVGFDTAEWTEIDDGLKVGDQVRVAGLVGADGIWVAEKIERLDTDHTTPFVFAGPVVSLNPWNVRGVLLSVDEHTIIQAGIIVGEMVKVTGWILEDGTWLATEIKPIDLHPGQGCYTVSSVVQSLTDEEIILTDGQVIARTAELEVQGDLQVNSLVRYEVCVDQDGVSTIRRITVVYQYPDDDLPQTGGKVVICHIPPGNPGNQHTIEVGQPAVAAHMAHGDTMGACPSERPGKSPKKDK